ncbi:CPBP family intramembrane glutamic endopeptidase [Ekhidna sp.]|uniref:CPBP family intramembrane glutamic endopeptidase n=1 Tax=Ekhidna sp. TaxID=2608089 RepID=UPI003B5C0805
MTTPTRAKKIRLFIFTILVGYLLFILPNLFFGISKWNGGLSGINLFYTAIFQFVTVTALVKYSLKKAGHDLHFIGLIFRSKDVLIGAAIGLAWTALQFLWIIPATGGAERADVANMVKMLDGGILSLLSFISLGVIGGGITEEVFNRGYFINALKETFSNPKIGLYMAAILSMIFFIVGHLPSNQIELMDITIPTLAYTLIFIKTGRLTAPIVTHGLYNMLAIILVHHLYNV